MVVLTISQAVETLKVALAVPVPLVLWIVWMLMAG